jgi:hypothetical protein
MEANAAVEIAEALGANLIYDDALRLFKVYFGEAWCYLQPKDLEQASLDGYKEFLVGVISHEAEQILRYGGPTRH